MPFDFDVKLYVSEQKRLLLAKRYMRVALAPSSVISTGEGERSISLTAYQKKELFDKAEIIANKDRSDPFTKNRIISHVLNGVKSLGDYMEEYNVSG